MGRAVDLWRDLCNICEKPDGHPTWDEAGKWTEDKLFFWKSYIDITTKAMSGHKSFPGGLVYIDLFGGAGICTLKGSNRRFPGSALIAAHAAKPFDKIIVCEQNPALAEACHNRLKNTDRASTCEVLIGDCNEIIGQIIRKIPDRALTLAFVDPKGLDARFDTITELSKNARVDYVILFADAYDINRNAEHVYRPDPNSKLDQVLGPESNWRQDLDALDNPDHVSRRKKFAEIYMRQLKRLLGYEWFHEKVMTCRGVPLYRLVYASKNELGLKFWKEALKQDSSGQRSLFN